MTRLWVELAAVAVVTAFVILWAELRLEHVREEATLARVGAVIHGLSLGLFIGFVLLPIRAVAAAEAEGLDEFERTAIAFSFAPALILFILLRRGALSRLPLIGRPLRAYRRASLRLQIKNARRTLDRLERLDKLAADAQTSAAAPTALESR